MGVERNKEKYHTIKSGRKCSVCTFISKSLFSVRNEFFMKKKKKFRSLAVAVITEEFQFNDRNFNQACLSVL